MTDDITSAVLLTNCLVLLYVIFCPRRRHDRDDARQGTRTRALELHVIDASDTEGEEVVLVDGEIPSYPIELGDGGERSQSLTPHGCLVQNDGTHVVVDLVQHTMSMAARQRMLEAHPEFVTIATNTLRTHAKSIDAILCIAMWDANTANATPNPKPCSFSLGENLRRRYT